MKYEIIKYLSWLIVLVICAVIGAFVVNTISQAIDYAAAKECFDNKTPEACEWSRE